MWVKLATIFAVAFIILYGRVCLEMFEDIVINVLSTKIFLRIMIYVSLSFILNKTLMKLLPINDNRRQEVKEEEPKKYNDVETQYEISESDESTETETDSEEGWTKNDMKAYASRYLDYQAHKRACQELPNGDIFRINKDDLLNSPGIKGEFLFCNPDGTPYDIKKGIKEHKEFKKSAGYVKPVRTFSIDTKQYDDDGNAIFADNDKTDKKKHLTGDEKLTKLLEAIRSTEK